MKFFKKVFIPLMLALLLVALTACGSGGNNTENIVGEWKQVREISDIIDVEIFKDCGDFYKDFEGFDGKIEMTTLYEFKADGEFVLTYKLVNLKSSMDKWLENFVVFAKKVITKDAKEKGLTYEQADSSYKEETGFSYEETIKARFTEEFFAEEEIEDEQETGKYKVEDNKLYITESNEEFGDSHITVKISGKKLTLEFESEPGEDTIEQSVLTKIK